MTAWEIAKAVGIIGPIIAMLIVGVIVATRSGVSRLNDGPGVPRLAANLSHTLLMVGGCLVGLAVIHQLVGQNLPRFW